MTMINTNVGALLARTYATKAAEKMQTSMERLSSGKRINGAADDAAGLAVANKMQSQLSGIKMAIRNSQDGISLLQTADGALGEVSKIIRRMRELAVQMQNGIYTATDRSNAQMEVRALLAEVDKIAANTQYNKVSLLDGTYDQTVRAGNTNSETIRISADSVATSKTAQIEAHALEVAEDNGNDFKTGNVIKIQEAVKGEIDLDVWSTAFKDLYKQDGLGTFAFSTSTATATDPNGGGSNVAGNGGTDNGDFTLDTSTGKLTSTVLDFENPADAGTNNGYVIQVTYTPRVSSGLSAHIENFTLTVTDKGTTELDDITVETKADASRAVQSLDKALEEISTNQAKLGAIENRLSHNIDNLSKGSMLTEQSVGRIIDADFAAETAELSKQQILSQAATSMLAQANVSKQGVIALLR
jgi:flagellin